MSACWGRAAFFCAAITLVASTRAFSGQDDQNNLLDFYINFEPQYYNTTVAFMPRDAESFGASVSYLAVDIGVVSKHGFYMFDVSGIYRSIWALASDEMDIHLDASDGLRQIEWIRLLRLRGIMTHPSGKFGPGSFGLGFNLFSVMSGKSKVVSTAEGDNAFGGLGTGVGPGYYWQINRMLTAAVAAVYSVNLQYLNTKKLEAEHGFITEADLWFFPLRWLGVHSSVSYEMYFYNKHPYGDDLSSSHTGAGALFFVKVGLSFGIPKE